MSHRFSAVMLFVALFALYNANGREIGGYDSQPAKFGARALALRGNLRLDTDVARQPLLAERAPFAQDRQGRFRSAYSPMGSLFGAVPALGLRALGADLNAPRGANLIAVLTASALTAAAVCLVFLTLVRLCSRRIALMVAVGLGLGTGFWPVHSQTMVQHDVVAFGVALALFSWTRPTRDLVTHHLWIGALGLAFAVTARTQVIPLVGLMALGLLIRVGWRRASGPLALTAGLLMILLAAQWRWFGHPLGAMRMLEQLHPEVHALTGSLSREPWVGAAGLLVSPNRGLFIYSPIVLIALAGIGPALRRLRDHGLGWALAGALALSVGYSLYTVWWGGHGYGPRYLLDVLVVLTVPAAVALDERLRGPVMRGVCAAALAWSIVVAGTGAFFQDTWNTTPVSVDRNHERLWDWRDPQILRAWQSGLSPQNFNLFNWTVWRTTQE